MFSTSGSPDSVCTTLATAAANAGWPAVAVSDWMSTLSRAGILKLPSARICSARRDSPFAIAQSFISRAPTAPPTKTASTAKAIHPNAAVFQCDALQRPARAARFVPAMTTCPLFRIRPREIRRDAALSIARSAASDSGKTLIDVCRRKEAPVRRLYGTPQRDPRRSQMSRTTFIAAIAAAVLIAALTAAASAVPAPAAPPIPTVFTADQLTRIYRGDDGGALYLRQLG